MKIIGIIGSRHRHSESDYKKILKALYCDQWDEMGKGARFVRNTYMARYLDVLKKIKKMEKRIIFIDS